MRLFSRRTVGAVVLATAALAADARQARAGIKIGVEITDAGGGTLVKKVFPRSLAGRMGLRPGDVLVRVNGKRVTSADQFAGVLARTSAITVVWERRGRYYAAWASQRVLTGADGSEREVVTVKGQREIEDPDDGYPDDDEMSRS
ncbi:MAG: PDZ domain-containing protein [Gemmataceae bacterium]|nr:PDZ domain-containing protein [Gemmataceae bacterium]